MVKATWQDTQQMGIYLEDTIVRPQTQRYNNVFLSDAFVAIGCQNKALFALNWCRTYLQVLQLSDITNAAGSHIHLRIWECEVREDWASQYNWSRNKRPSLDAQIIWKDALQRALLQNGPGRILQL